ncbi:MAG: sigma-70 family RNA polymerase sigma factor [Chitinophagaceae bacterium]|nr:sigma-70 family RNA polymerase sigma factor [Chitinophagaceae bacterium]
MKHPQNTYTDTELLQQFRKTADSQWLGWLFERYSLLVFGVCMKYLRNATDAQDATQHVFEKALGEVSKYEIPFFKSWIYSVAKNHCLMQLRNRSSKPGTTDELLEETSADLQTEQELKMKELLMEEQSSHLKAALNELSQEQKSCIQMFYLEKLSYHDIETKTGFSFSQVKSHIQNGKRNLRIILEKKIREHVN